MPSPRLDGLVVIIRIRFSAVVQASGGTGTQLTSEKQRVALVTRHTMEKMRW